MVITEKRCAKCGVVKPLSLFYLLTHYGNDKLTCVRCGYDDIRALSIDHIDGGGHKHREKIGGANFYVWLEKYDYPEGYQTLCMRCQWIKKDENREYGKAKIAEFVKII